TSRHPGRRARMALEVLEDRTALSNYVVNALGDSSGSNSGHGTGTFSGDLRYCINQAIQASEPATITFDASVFSAPNPISLSSTPSTDPGNANQYGPTGFVVSGNANITLIGPSAGVTIDGGGVQRLFVVTSIATLLLQDLTLQGGKALGDDGAAGAGGAA